MARFDAVLFAWGGVLTPWHDVDVRQAWEAFAHGFGTMACAFRDLTGRLVEADAAAWALAHAERKATRIEDLLRSCGVDPESPPGEAGLAAYYDFWAPHTVTHPLVWYTLPPLREAGVKVGVVSNTIWPRSNHDGLFVRDEVAEFIDVAVYSSDVGRTKPHPLMFTTALDALGVRADRTVFVGDRLHEDIEGAAALGLTTVLLEHEVFAGDHVRPSDAKPDHVIGQLDEVLALVL